MVIINSIGGFNMKKSALIIGLILISFSFIGCTSLKDEENLDYNNEVVYEDIVNEIIRFH